MIFFKVLCCIVVLSLILPSLCISVFYYYSVLLYRLVVIVSRTGCVVKKELMPKPLSLRNNVQSVSQSLLRRFRTPGRTVIVNGDSAVMSDGQSLRFLLSNLQHESMLLQLLQSSG